MPFCERKARMNFGRTQDSAPKPFQPREENKRILQLLIIDFGGDEFGGGADDFQVTDEDINIGISLKKGNTELKEAIDSVLSKMTKDDFSAMMDEAISVQPLAN